MKHNHMWRHQLANKIFPITECKITLKSQKKLFEHNLQFATCTETLFDIFGTFDDDLWCIYNNNENNRKFPVKWSDFDVAFCRSINRGEMITKRLIFTEGIEHFEQVKICKCRYLLYLAKTFCGEGFIGYNESWMIVCIFFGLICAVLW